MPRSAPSGAGAAGPLPHPVHVSQRRDVGASCGALRLRGAAVRCGQPMENSRKVGRTGAPMIVPDRAYGDPVRPSHFTSVPDPSAQPPRLGCCRLRGRPRRPGRRAGGRDEKPVSAGLRAVGAVVPGLPAAAPAPVWLPHRRSRRRPPIRPPLAPVLPQPQFSRRRGNRSTGQDPPSNRSRDPAGVQSGMVPPHSGASDRFDERSRDLCIFSRDGTPPGSRDPRRLDALHRCGSDLTAQPLASGSSGWSL